MIVNDRDSDNRYMLEPFSFPRFGDGLIADFVSNETHLRSNQAPLYFQGGNVLIGDDFFFIGADYPAKSLDYINRVIVPNPNEKPVAAVRRLYREYMDTDRRLFYIGSTIPVPAQTERQIVIGGEQWKEILYLGNKQGTVQPPGSTSTCSLLLRVAMTMATIRFSLVIPRWLLIRWAWRFGPTA